MPEKTCSICKRSLPYDEFSGAKTTKDHKTSYCRDCKRKYMRKYRQKYTRKKPKEKHAKSENRTGAMDGWTEWHPLPHEILEAMGDKEYREYCRWWCKAHPIDLEAIAKGLLAGMRNVMDDYDHTNTKEVKFDR